MMAEMTSDMVEVTCKICWKNFRSLAISIGNKDCKYSALCPFNRKTRNLVNQKMILKSDLSASEELKNNSKTVINASQSPC